VAAPAADAAVIEWVRAAVERDGVGVLVVDDLRADDLPVLEWSGSRLHLESVAQNLARVPEHADYLCVRASVGGAAVAKGGVDYEEHPGGGTIWQVAVHPELQGLGLGSFLIAACEERIRRRGLPTAWIGVEDGNDGALRLYERLGYSPSGRWSSSWAALNESGQEYVHEAGGIDLSKAL
jgi:ribosomal protein S18 acetylase RimI-like enzyme